MSADRDLFRRYTDITCIGRGQSSRVYRATDRSTGRVVALKALDRSTPTAMFLQELSALLRLRHPNVVSCWGIEYGPGDRYLVMDYCAGGSLRERLTGPIAPGVALAWVDDILKGLAEIHRQGFLHCDLKPDNVLLTGSLPGSIVGSADQDFANPNSAGSESRSIARISDFGLVRGVDQGYFELGSPAYMAPERFDGTVSPATDLYAVGILLFELLTGDRPFHGSPAELRLAHRQALIPALETRLPSAIAVMIPEAHDAIPPVEWNRILQIALHKRPGDRFANAEDFRCALGTIASL
jgi:serine/threonine protein kinase